jgi:RNA polymerase sigma-70 factor, ECF subfamily
VSVDATDSVIAAQEDEELAQQAASEAAAFAQLYERYLRPVRRYVLSQVADRPTAEDLTAQIFLKALVSASSYRGEGSYRSWIFQIARNTISTWRAERGTSEIPVEDIPEEPEASETPPVLTLADLDREVVIETVNELPEAQREVVRLRYWKDLTVEEIARATRRSSGAVRQLLHRARRRLRKKLSHRDLTAIAGAATGASALAIYSIRRNRRRQK